MDFFSLPDVFLRQLMKTVEIKDRLRMRLTCRAFEKLVAETHAGYFYDGRFIYGNDQSTFPLQIGLAHFTIPATEDGFRQCLKLRNRLFTGIEIEYFTLNWDGLTNDFVCQFTRKFKIDDFTFFVNCQRVLEISRQMMTNFPTSKYSMYLYFLPEPDTLLALPSMESLRIRQYTNVETEPWLINRELFFNLLNAHECLDLDNTILQEDDCDRALMMISDHNDARNVQVELETSVIKHWLINHGSKEGDRYGEFEVLEIPGKVRRHDSLILHYKNAAAHSQCTIKVHGNVFEYGYAHTRMSISNRQ